MKLFAELLMPHALLRIALLVQVGFSIFTTIRKLYGGSVCVGWSLINVSACCGSITIGLFIISTWDEPDRVGIMTFAACAYAIDAVGRLMLLTPNRLYWSREKRTMQSQSNDSKSVIAASIATATAGVK